MTYRSLSFVAYRPAGKTYNSGSPGLPSAKIPPHNSQPDDCIARRFGKLVIPDQLIQLKGVAMGCMTACSSIESMQ